MEGASLETHAREKVHFPCSLPLLCRSKSVLLMAQCQRECSCHMYRTMVAEFLLSVGADGSTPPVGACQGESSCLMHRSVIAELVLSVGANGRVLRGAMPK